MAIPVVFVHGLWLHADSWGAWVDRFREAGYAPVAPGWPGDSATVDAALGDLLANNNTDNAARGPLVLTAGGKDHTVPPGIVKATHKLYRKSPAVTDYKEFPDRGHSLALDSGWHEVADFTLAWLKEHSL